MMVIRSRCSGVRIFWPCERGDLTGRSRTSTGTPESGDTKVSHFVSQIDVKTAKSGKTQQPMESEESLSFTGDFSQFKRFQRVAKMAYFAFTVCPVLPLRYLSINNMNKLHPTQLLAIDVLAKLAFAGFFGDGFERDARGSVSELCMN